MRLRFSGVFQLTPCAIQIYLLTFLLIVPARNAEQTVLSTSLCQGVYKATELN